MVNKIKEKEKKKIPEQKIAGQQKKIPEQKGKPGQQSFYDVSDEVDPHEKIVNEMLDTDQNLSSKTELKNPVHWAALETYESYVESKNLLKSKARIENFRETTFKYKVSKNREGRKEYIKLASNSEEKDKKDDIENLLKTR